MFSTGQLALAALTSLLATAHAASSTLSTAACSPTISVKNGGFESGAISPWTGSANSQVKATVVSPGYNSAHAIRLDLPASTVVNGAYLSYSLSQVTTGTECYGHYYNISYAYNWVHYTGPQGKPASADGPRCLLNVLTGYTDHEDVYQYGSSTPGWHTASYIARDVYSHCNNLASEFSAEVYCYGPNGTTFPAFSIELDALSIQATSQDPTKPALPSCS